MTKISKLKQIVEKFPDIRHNISEDTFDPNDGSDDMIDNHYGYFLDEWDTWEHMDIEERWEYFSQIFDTIKELKKAIAKL